MGPRARRPALRGARHVQGIHSSRARRAGGGATVPVLVCEEGVLRESAEIVAYATGSPPPTAGWGAATAAFERELDEDFGRREAVDVRRAPRFAPTIAADYVTPTVPA